MSVAALALVIAHVSAVGIAAAPDADEGTAAHLWQILLAGQLPVIAYFAMRWLPRRPRQALGVLGLQVVAALAAAAPVFLLHM